MKNNKYKYREDYFTSITSHKQAYWLGLLYADGSVSKDKSTVYLKLKEEDSYLLEDFKTDLNLKKPLYYRKAGLIKNTSYMGKGQYKLEICSNIFKQSLIKLGCTPDKSNMIRFPVSKQVPKEFLSSFIHGYFDGDGSIYESNNRLFIKIVSNKIFVEQLLQFLEKEINLIGKIYKDNRHENVYSLAILRKEEVYKFCSYIYSNAFKGLTRKHNKFKQKNVI